MWWQNELEDEEGEDQGCQVRQRVEDPGVGPSTIKEGEMNLETKIPKEDAQDGSINAGEEDVPTPQVPSVDTLWGRSSS